MSNSLDHKHWMKVGGLYLGTHWSTTLCMAEVSSANMTLKLSLSCIGHGGLISSTLVVSCSLKLSYLTILQLKHRAGLALSGVTSTAPTTGKWSVCVDQGSGQLLHSIKEVNRSVLMSVGIG